VNYQGTREASGISAGTVLNSQIPVLPTDVTLQRCGGVSSGWLFSLAD